MTHFEKRYALLTLLKAAYAQYRAMRMRLVAALEAGDATEKAIFEMAAKEGHIARLHRELAQCPKKP